ncbi:MAG TPA: hypothetical protein VFS88_03135 [Micavibrio sp.]|nr:hypothetical protein [Micavibrio sp.]
MIEICKNLDWDVFTAITSIAWLGVTFWAACEVNDLTKLNLRKQNREIVEKIIELQTEARKVIRWKKPYNSEDFIMPIYHAMDLAELHGMVGIKSFLLELVDMHAGYKAQIDKISFGDMEVLSLNETDTLIFEREAAIFLDKLRDISAYKNYLNGI